MIPEHLEGQVITRMDERRDIARQLDESKDFDINSVPEVQEARAKSNEAHDLAEKASREFSRVFNKHDRRNLDHILIREHPGLLVFGEDDLGDRLKWIARCAVTGLPIFVGDRVYIGGGEESYERSYILAEAVEIAPGYEREPVVVDENGEGVQL